MKLFKCQRSTLHLNVILSSTELVCGWENVEGGANVWTHYWVTNSQQEQAFMVYRYERNRYLNWSQTGFKLDSNWN